MCIYLKYFRSLHFIYWTRVRHTSTSISSYRIESTQQNCGSANKQSASGFVWLWLLQLNAVKWRLDISSLSVSLSLPLYLPFYLATLYQLHDGDKHLRARVSAQAHECAVHGLHESSAGHRSWRAGRDCLARSHVATGYRHSLHRDESSEARHEEEPERSRALARVSAVAGGRQARQAALQVGRVDHRQRSQHLIQFERVAQLPQLDRLVEHASHEDLRGDGQPLPDQSAGALLPGPEHAHQVLRAEQREPVPLQQGLLLGQAQGREGEHHDALLALEERAAQSAARPQHRQQHIAHAAQELSRLSAAGACPLKAEHSHVGRQHLARHVHDHQCSAATTSRQIQQQQQQQQPKHQQRQQQQQPQQRS